MRALRSASVQTLRSLLGRIRALPPAARRRAARGGAAGRGPRRDPRPLAAARRRSSRWCSASSPCRPPRWPSAGAGRSWRCSPSTASSRSSRAVGRDVTDNMAGPFFWLLLAGYTWGMHTEGARPVGGRRRSPRRRSSSAPGVDAYDGRLHLLPQLGLPDRHRRRSCSARCCATARASTARCTRTRRARRAASARRPPTPPRSRSARASPATSTTSSPTRSAR